MFQHSNTAHICQFVLFKLLVYNDGPSEKLKAGNCFRFTVKGHLQNLPR